MSLFPKFTYDELVRFIQCMDLLIEEATDLIVVGGQSLLPNGSRAVAAASVSMKDSSIWPFQEAAGVRHR